MKLAGPESERGSPKAAARTTIPPRSGSGELRSSSQCSHLLLMKSSFVFILLFALAASFAAAPAPRLDDTVAGEKLARELRSLVPTTNVEIKGVMRLSQPGSEARELPLQSKVMVSAESWSSTYKAGDETLIIQHFANKPNAYSWVNRDGGQHPANAQATNRFAGSDFALLDLGLEFFHWPTQTVVAKEMRKGRGCVVLESRPAAPGLYAHVFSWIDAETSGLLMAEAYDTSGRLLKEFEVFVLSVEKGQVSKMEIRNRQTKSSTRLQFDLDKE